MMIRLDRILIQHLFMDQYLEECIILDLDIELIKTELMKFNLSILLCYLIFSYSLNLDAQTKSDLIFVDGSHEYKDSKKDMNSFYKMLSKSGVLAAHDIHNREFPGVNKAWKEFKMKKGFQFKEIVHKKYYFDCGMGVAVKK